MLQGKNRNLLLVLLVALMALEGGLSGLSLLSTGPAYSSGYQGAKVQYAGVQYAGKNMKMGLWDTTFSWDSDTRASGKPAIAGEMTSVFVPEESVGYQPTWIDPEWLLGATRIKNPVDFYEWELPDPTGQNETLFYRMELWRCKWYFSISCEPTGGWGDPPECEDGEIPEPALLAPKRNGLQDVRVWFEFDIQPTWYFEGTDTAYFAMAEVRITDMAIGARKTTDPNDPTSFLEKNKACRVRPMSPNSILPIYYGLFGSEANRADKKAYEYEGRALNPQLFTGRVYSYFTLEDFGVSSWWEFIAKHYKADVVTAGLDVDVFVIGEWKVKDIQEIPDEYGRSSKQGYVGFPIASALLEFLSSPSGRFTFLLILGVIVLIILTLFAPWVFVLLSQLLGGRRRTG